MGKRRTGLSARVLENFTRKWPLPFRTTANEFFKELNYTVELALPLGLRFRDARPLASGLGFDMDGASSQTLVVVPPTRGLNSVSVFHADHCANQMLTPVPVNFMGIIRKSLPE